MKMVAVYLAKATEFDALARRFDKASAKKPYLDMADILPSSGGRAQTAYRGQEVGWEGHATIRLRHHPNARAPDTMRGGHILMHTACYDAVAEGR